MITHRYEVGRFGDDGICHAPTAEGRCWERKSNHMPYHIKDMAVDTTFTAEAEGGNGVVHHFRVTADVRDNGKRVLHCITHQFGASEDYVDESTIRDVVPPVAEDAKKNSPEWTLTVADLLNEECETFTSGTCADEGSGRVPVSEDGTYREYCGPCRLRYAFKKDVVEPVESAAEAKKPSRYHVVVHHADGFSTSNQSVEDIDYDETGTLMHLYNVQPQGLNRTFNLRHVKYYDTKEIKEN